MKMLLSILAATLVIGALPALALSEADRQRLNNGEGCPACDLSNANLNGFNLSNQDLSGANLSGANLNGVELYRANLSYANLTNAILTNANISFANFTGANLTGANFSKIHELNTEGVIFDNAIICNTIYYDGRVESRCP